MSVFHFSPGVKTTRVAPVSPTMASPQPTALPTVIPEIVLNNALRISILEHTAESVSHLVCILGLYTSG